MFQVKKMYVQIHVLSYTGIYICLCSLFLLFENLDHACSVNGKWHKIVQHLVIGIWYIAHICF